MPVFSEPQKLLGTSAPGFSLPGVDGASYSLSHFKDCKALVVAFICNHCPYVQATLDRINRLAKEYAPKGVRLVAINSNDTLRYPDDSFDKMKELAKAKGLVFPYLFDETQETAKAYQAVCTPEFYAYQNHQGNFTLKYHGRLDDNWKDETAVTQRDLALALDQILLGADPAVDQKPAMGCSIKWKLSHDR